MEIGRRGTATARSRRRFAALDLRRLTTACFHSHAARRGAGLASGHATNRIDVTTGHPPMKPSHNAQHRATAVKGITAVRTLRGAWTVAEGENAMLFCAAYVRDGSWRDELAESMAYN